MTLDHIATWVAIVCTWSLIRMAKWYEGNAKIMLLNAAIFMGVLNFVILVVRFW
jgi:hypothetical protein